MNDQSRSDAGWSGRLQPPAPPLTAMPASVGSPTTAPQPPAYPPPGSPPLIEGKPFASGHPATPRSRPPILWVVLAAILLVSTGVTSYLYVETKGRLSDAEVSLASTRSDLQGARQHASKLDGQLQKTSDELKQTEGDLKEVKSEAAGLEDDLKTAEVCLKGLVDIGTATSPQQMVQVLLRVGDECRSAYKAVGDRFPT